MNTPFQPVSSGARLSDQVAQQLVQGIKAGQFPAGGKLPTEARLAEQFAVSRTVVREAVSRLKSLGLVDSRQGSGVYITGQGAFAPLDFDARHAESRSAVAQMIEVRRALEAEAAGLAAQRCGAADMRRIRQAMLALEKAVARGGDGVEEDLRFHRSVAEAGHNPFLIGTLDYLAQFMRGAISVTRANEARRADFTTQVRDEHAAIAQAIATGDVDGARAAAATHMVNAVRRMEDADPAFWRQHGERLAQPLVHGLRRG